MTIGDFIWTNMSKPYRFSIADFFVVFKYLMHMYIRTNGNTFTNISLTANDLHILA